MSVGRVANQEGMPVANCDAIADSAAASFVSSRDWIELGRAL